MNLKIIKLSLFLTIAVLCHSVFSGTMGPNQIEYPNGFYVGGTIGVSDLQDTANHEVQPETHHLGGFGILGGGILGYQWNFASQFTISLEGFANASGLNTSIQHYDQSTGMQDNSEKMHSRYNAGIRVMPGIQFSPQQEAHLIIGYSNANFKHTDNGTYGFIDTDCNKNGIQAGAGWKTGFFNPAVLIRLDVLYTNYQGQRSIGLGLPDSGSIFQFYNNQFNTLEADLSLIYQFH